MDQILTGLGCNLILRSSNENKCQRINYVKSGLDFSFFNIFLGKSICSANLETLPHFLSKFPFCKLFFGKRDTDLLIPPGEFISFAHEHYTNTGNNKPETQTMTQRNKHGTINDQLKAPKALLNASYFLYHVTSRRWTVSHSGADTQTRWLEFGWIVQPLSFALQPLSIVTSCVAVYVFVNSWFLLRWLFL